MKIKTKIQLYSTIWLLVILLISSVAIYLLFSKVITDTEVNRVRAQTETIAAVLHAQADHIVSPGDLFRAYLPSQGMIRLIKSDDQATFTVTRDVRFNDIPGQFRAHQGQMIYRLPDGERVVIVYFPVIWTDGSVVILEVTESLAPIQANMALLRNVLLLASLLVLIPSIFGGSLLSKLILRPIKSIVGTMREIQ